MLLTFKKKNNGLMEICMHAHFPFSLFPKNNLCVIDFDNLKIHFSRSRMWFQSTGREKKLVKLLKYKREHTQVSTFRHFKPT